MEDLEKTRKIIKTTFFVAVVVITVLLVFPHDMQPHEWEIYASSYFVTTLGLTVIGAAIGILFGMFLAFLKFLKTNFPIFDMIKEIIIDEYIDIMRGTPMILQLLILSVLIKLFDNYWIAMIALGLNSAAYVAEVVRSGIESIDKGQMEAARATGMPYKMAMNEIIMPQAIKNILPTLANEFISLLKETSIAGYIALEDLTKAGDIIRSRTYSAFMPLIGVALIYLILVLLLSTAAKALERRLKRGER